MLVSRHARLQLFASTAKWSRSERKSSLKESNTTRDSFKWREGYCMSVPRKDRYSLLSKAIRIANSASLSYQLRLKSLAKFLANTFSCQSVTIYISDDSRRYLSSAVSSISTSNVYACRRPFVINRMYIEKRLSPFNNLHRVQPGRRLAGSLPA